MIEQLYTMRITGLFHRVMTDLNRNQRGIIGLEIAIIILVLIGIVSMFTVPDLTKKIRGAETSPESGPSDLAESTAELVLIGGVVGTEDPTGSFVDSIVFRLTPGGKSLRSVDLSTEGAYVVYLDDFRAFDIPPGQWSAVWRRGNGPILDSGEIVEMRVFLRSLYPPLGTRTGFAILINPVRGSVLTVRRTTPSKIASIMALE